MSFTVQMAEEEFQILGPDGEEGCIVDYGEVATLQIGQAVYYCLCADAEETPVVMRVQSYRPMPTETEDVKFEDTDEDAEGPVLVQAEADAAEPEVVE